MRTFFKENILYMVPRFIIISLKKNANSIVTNKISFEPQLLGMLIDRFNPEY